MANHGGQFTSVQGSPKGYSHSHAGVSGGGDNPRGAPIGGKDDGTGGRERGTPTWYSDLVDYYDKRVRYARSWWDDIDAEYSSQAFRTAFAEHGDRTVLEEVRPGRVYSLVHTVEAMTFNKKPKLFLRGWNSKVQEEWVPVMEEVLNAEWYDDPTVPRQTRLCIRDCVKYGWGIMLTTWEGQYEPGEPEPAPEPLDEENEPMLRDALAELEGEVGAQMAEATPSPEEVPTFEQDDRLIVENINSRRVDPRLFMADPDATCPEDWKWVGRKIVTDLHAVKEFFKGHKHADMLHATERADLDTGKAPKDNASPYEYITLYEIWERTPGGGWRYVLVPKDHDFILKSVDDMYHGGCPYQLLRWNEDGNDIIPQSDIVPAWSLILLERIMMTKAADGYTREHIDTYLYAKNNGINEEELNAVNDPGVDKYVGCTLPDGRSLKDLIHKLPKDPKSPEVLQLLAIVERQLEVATGLGPNQFGNALRSGTSASEAMEVAGFSRARGQHKYSAVEEFVAQIASFRLALMIQFYDAERVARIAGEEAAKEWAEIKTALNHRGEIQKGLRVRVEQGSMRPENDDMRLQQLYSLLQLVGGNPVLMGTFNIVEIAKDIGAAMGQHRNSKYLMTEDGGKAAEAGVMMALMQNGQQGSQPAANASPQSPGQAQQQQAGPAAGGASEGSAA